MGGKPRQKPVSKWDSILRPAILKKQGAKCSTTAQLARRLGVSKGALVSAYSRFLPEGPGLASYLKEPPVPKSRLDSLPNREFEKLLIKAGKAATNVLQLSGAMEPLLGFSVSSSTLQRQVGKRGLGSLSNFVTKARQERRIKPEDVRFPMSHELREGLSRAEVIVVTSALNNTPVHAASWKVLLRYVKERNAQLVVLPQRYKNPTSQKENSRRKENAWWPKEVMPYVTDDLVEVHEHLLLMGNARIQATAKDPLLGMDELTKAKSAVFGHAKLAMKTIPTPQRRHVKALWTTGSISQRNYSESKAGIRSQFHHSIGALVIELDGPRFYARPILMDEENGSFYDLNRFYHQGGSRRSPKCPALVIGDEHCLFADPETVRATFEGPNSIVHTLRPEKLIRHDVLDFFSGSHHEINDAVAQYARHKSGRHRVEDELNHCAEYINRTTPAFAESVVVASNHHDHVLRWMKEQSPRTQPWNADVWLALWAELVTTARVTDRGVEHVDPFAAWTSPRLTCRHRFLARDDHEDIEGILCGFHSDRGINGSRGSIRQFSRIAARTIIGHGHGPGIFGGCWQVGVTARRDMSYANNGPSNWAAAHCVILPSGKRQMIFCVGEYWRLQ